MFTGIIILTKHTKSTCLLIIVNSLFFCILYIYVLIKFNKEIKNLIICLLELLF
jgi:hypothetical protein